MRKLIVSEFVTLDGVMQAPGGKDEDRDGGFEHGGWTMPYWHNDIGQAFGTLMKDVDALLLGRRTYITHAAAFHALLAHDLVDELHLLLYPLTVGGGKRLLPEGVYATFNLTAATPYPTGVVGLHYNRQRTL
jgi:dihydrofolate reductase